MEFEHKLLRQFSVAVARRMPYTSILSICTYEIAARPHEDFLFSSLPEFVCEVTVIGLIEWVDPI